MSDNVCCSSCSDKPADNEVCGGAGADNEVCGGAGPDTGAGTAAGGRGDAVAAAGAGSCGCTVAAAGASGGAAAGCDRTVVGLERVVSLYPALIFDMDGTVMNSEIRHHEAWNHMLEEFGFECLGSDVFYGFASLPGLEITRRICEQYQSATPHKADPVAMNARKNELYEEIYIRKADAFPYFVDLIKQAHARGQRIAIATSSRQHEARYLMEKAGLMGWLDSIISGDMVENGKPAPDIYLLAAASLNMPYQDCLVFEDSVLGMKGAAAARMAAIKVFDGHYDCQSPVLPQ